MFATNIEELHYNKYKQDALISQIYFGMKLYMFRTVPLSIIRNLFTVHSAMVYVILKIHKPDQQLENNSTKYHRQQPLYNTLELLMMGIVVPETC